MFDAADCGGGHGVGAVHSNGDDRGCASCRLLEGERTDQVVAALRRPNRTAEWLYGSACVAACKGDAEEAVNALNQLLDSLPPSAVAWQLPIDPSFLTLHHHDGFKALRDRLADRAK